MSTRAWTLLAVAVALAGCATRDPLRPTVVPAQDLAPYASLEECVDLVRGDRLDYRFDSNEPVHFALQYREGPAVIVPIDRQNSTGDSAIYPVPDAHRYCLTWEAGAAGARIAYRFVAHRGR